MYGINSQYFIFQEEIRTIDEQGYMNPKYVEQIVKEFTERLNCIKSQEKLLRFTLAKTIQQAECFNSQKVALLFSKAFPSIKKEEALLDIKSIRACLEVEEGKNWTTSSLYKQYPAIYDMWVFCLVDYLMTRQGLNDESNRIQFLSSIGFDPLLFPQQIELVEEQNHLFMSHEKINVIGDQGHIEPQYIEDILNNFKNLALCVERRKDLLRFALGRLIQHTECFKDQQIASLFIKAFPFIEQNDLESEIRSIRSCLKLKEGRELHASTLYRKQRAHYDQWALCLVDFLIFRRGLGEEENQNKLLSGLGFDLPHLSLKQALDKCGHLTPHYAAHLVQKFMHFFPDELARDQRNLLFFVLKNLVQATTYIRNADIACLFVKAFCERPTFCKEGDDEMIDEEIQNMKRRLGQKEGEEWTIPPNKDLTQCETEMMREIDQFIFYQNSADTDRRKQLLESMGFICEERDYEVIDEEIQNMRRRLGQKEGKEWTIPPDKDLTQCETEMMREIDQFIFYQNLGNADRRKHLLESMGFKSYLTWEGGRLGVSIPLGEH